MSNKTEETLKNIAHTIDTEDYSRTFDESNVNWTNVKGYNTLFLRSQEIWVNDLLAARGHVLLNDIYEALGFPRTPVGAIVGWIWKSTNNEYARIVFDMQENLIEDAPSIELNFNVQGIIYDKI